MQRKDGRWWGRIEGGYTATGGRRRISVIASTEAECKRRLQAKRKELETEDGLTASRLTVKGWADEWLPEYVLRVRPGTASTDTSIVRKWIVPAIGQRRLDQLTPADARKVVQALRAAGRSSTTQGYAVAVLKRMLKAAVQDGHRVPPPVLAVAKPSEAVHDRDAIPVADAARLLAAADQAPDGVRWWLAITEGLRQAEALGLTWDALDLDAATMGVEWQLQALPYLDRSAGVFRVPDGYEVRRLVGAFHLVRPKSRAGFRVVPLLDPVVERLRAWREASPVSPHGLVFPRAGGSARLGVGAPRSGAMDREGWRVLQETAGVSHPSGRRFVVHEARHTTATFLLAAGVDAGVVTMVMGHSSIATTRGYQHVDVAQARLGLGRAMAGLLAS